MTRTGGGVATPAPHYDTECMHIVLSRISGLSTWTVFFVITSGDYHNIKTKMFDFEARVLIGWLANTLASSRSKRALQSQTFLFLC